ncbi:MAG TPA: hypothetical protein VF234_08275 [Limnochordia bacterium]
MHRMLTLILVVGLAAATAAPAFARPRSGTGPSDHVPEAAAHACKGLTTAFTAPARGVEHMPERVAAWLWAQYTALCG